MRVAYNLFPGAGRIQLLSCVEEHEASLERERERDGGKKIGV